MNVMRYTIVDQRGSVSFVADCDTLVALVAGCCAGPHSLAELLSAAGKFDRRLREYVSSGLAIFDEHNSPENPYAIHGALDFCPPGEVPVFRVIDERTRQASLQPVKAGLIIFNLLDRRIVQVMNAYSEIRRKGRVRVHDGRRLTSEVYSYELPHDWRLVPGTGNKPVGNSEQGTGNRE